MMRAASRFFLMLVLGFSGVAAAAPAFGGNSPAVSACPAGESSYFVNLPFRSEQRLARFLEASILRVVCPLGYVNHSDDPRCRAAIDVQEGRAQWTFGKRVPASGPLQWEQSLTMTLLPSVSIGYDLHLQGVVKVATGQQEPKEQPSTDLHGLCGRFHEALKASARLNLPSDNVLTYSLSYIQADRAVALLRTLGYPVIEFKAESATDGTIKTLFFDSVFQEYEREHLDLLERPVIINVIDSHPTSIVDSASKAGGTAGDRVLQAELTGGQKLDGMTDGAPVQRLLIVHDTEDRKPLYDLLEHLEREIDIPARQILIEAVVLEVDKDEFDDLGFSYTASRNNFDLSFGEDAGGVIRPFVFGFETPHPKTLLEFVGRIRALVDSDDATVLSRPSVLVLDGRQAKINVGNNVPFTSKLTLDDGVALSETSYIKTGIVLNLRPRAAFDSSEVTFQVEAIISSAGPSRVSPELGVPIAPDIQSRQVQTIVRVANDTPFVIGGLISTTEQTNITGIPLLSRIPFLGRLFRRESNVNDHKEVIVMITPHIIEVDDRTFSYTVARDAPEDAAPSTEDSDWERVAGALGRGGDDEAKARPADVPKSWWSVEESQEPKRTPSVFDSFGSILFRNYYRLRSFDIFDFRFITDNEEHLKRVEKARDLAKSMTDATFSKLPAVDDEELIEETRRLLEEHSDGPSPRPSDKQIRTFLTLVENGVPGEEVLVHHMLIRLVEDLDLGWLVPWKKIVYFRTTEDGLDPTTLGETIETSMCADPKNASAKDCPYSGTIADCLRAERTVLVAFENPDDTSSCQRQPPRGQKGRPFNPPSVRLSCVDLHKDAYLPMLRKLNEGDRAALLLNTEYEARGLNPLQMLQSVLVLKRVLDLNAPETFPRTLRAYHVGRELVFPTQDDLDTRTHLIDCRTADLFFETLDYYEVFKDRYEEENPAGALKMLTGYANQVN